MIIYKSMNLINGKGYIGQTIKTLNQRCDRHFYLSDHNSNTIFHRAIRKYGKESFEWEVIWKGDDIKKLDILEIFYIEKYKTFMNEHGYNMTRGGYSTRGYTHSMKTKSKIGLSNKGKVSSKESRLKMSLSKIGEKNNRYGIVHSEETKQKISDAHKGKKLSEEHKQKISKSHKGKKLSDVTRSRIGKASKGRKHSDESKQKMRESSKNRERIKCPHCHKFIDITAANRWHFDNCKLNGYNRK